MSDKCAVKQNSLTCFLVIVKWQLNWGTDVSHLVAALIKKAYWNMTALGLVVPEGTESLALTHAHMQRSNACLSYKIISCQPFLQKHFLHNILTSGIFLLLHSPSIQATVHLPPPSVLWWLHPQGEGSCLSESCIMDDGARCTRLLLVYKDPDCIYSISQ